MKKDNYKSIVEKLKATRKLIVRRQVYEGVTDLLASAGAFLFILWLVTGLIWPGPAFRIILLILGACGIFSVFGYFILRPILKDFPLTKIALRLEKFYGKLQSRLIASLQLYDKLSKNRENYSIELIEKTIDEAGSEIKDIDFKVAVWKNKKPYYRLALSALFVLLAFSISGQTMSHVGLLYSHPFEAIHRPTNLRLYLTPLAHQAIKNEDVTVNIVAAGERTRRVDFNFMIADGKWVTVLADRSENDEGRSDSVFTYTFRKVKRDIKYFARAKNVKSSTGKITVIDPPSLTDVSIMLEHPGYTGLAILHLPNNDGSVTAIKGTTVNFAGKLNKPVVNANMLFDDGESKKLKVNDDRINGRFRLNKNGSYCIEVTDIDGLKNLDPIEYDLVCLEDYPPNVQITFPAIDIDLDDRMLVPIEAALYDDFGFSKLELVYWMFSEGRESNKKRQVLKDKFDGVNEAIFGYEWFVEKLYLMPGDLVYYYLEIFDNDAVSGAKSSVSKIYSARLPSLDEIMADITGAQDEIFIDFEEVVNNQKELKTELEELSREILNISEVDWEKKQQIQNTVNSQKNIAQKLEQLAEQMDQAIDKFEKNQMATMEMLEKMEEIRDLFEQVASPELKKAMKELQDALKNMDPDLLKEAMKNFKFSVEQMNENLDRMLSLLQKYQLEQKLDTMAKLAEKLAENQQQINDQLNQCQNKSEISDLEKPQQRQKQGLDNLREQFDQADKMNQELGMLSPEDMKQADEKINSQELDQQMMQMMNSLGACNKKSCSKSGKQLKQNFLDMAQLLKKMLKKMQSQQLEKITAMLRKAVSDIIYISHTQELIIDSTDIALRQLGGVNDVSRKQKDTETATSRVAQNISDITKETLLLNSLVMEKLGSALGSMQQSIDRLNSRHPSRAKGDQVQAMSSLNMAVDMLMNSLDQVSQCQSSGSGMQSFMQKLSQMAKMQQGINQQSQMMMPMPGQMMGLSQQQALQKLAQQQQALSQSLQELLDETASGNNSNILGRLDKLAEEMKQVSEKLRSNNPDRSLINRQEKILSRLLDAQKSVHRRDHSRQRQARSAENIIRQSPNMLLPLSTSDEKLAEDIRKALTEKYPRRYENLIKNYFKALTESEEIEQ